MMFTSEVSQKHRKFCNFKRLITF